MRTKTIFNTDPFRIVSIREGKFIAQRDTAEEAMTECLRLNRTHCKMMPDGFYDYDRITYVVQYRREYKNITVK